MIVLYTMVVISVDTVLRSSVWFFPMI